MAIEIRVTGIPPKKRTDISLWANETEVPRVIALRRNSRIAFADRKPFACGVRLRICLFLTPNDFISDQIGDLDNFVSGVCDALQAANTREEHLHGSFNLRENQDVDPMRPIAITNDRAVVSIVADKFLARKAQESYYTVVIDGD